MAVFDFRDRITKKLLKPQKAIARITKETDKTNRMMQKLNRMRINPRLRLNDRITRPLQKIRTSLSRLGQRITTATVKLNDQATPGIEKIDTALRGLADKALKVAAVAGITGGGLLFAGQSAYEMDARAAAVTGLPRDYFSESVQDIYYGSKAGTSRENVLTSLVGIGQQTDLRDQMLAESALYANMFSSLHPDMDVNQISRAASTFYNSMQADFQRTYDSMSYVWRNGGDMADDLADTYAEYASTFAKLGISPEQLASGLIAGQDAGAWNYDVLADALREWGIKSLNEFNEDAINAMGKLLGESRTTDLYKGILNGDVTGQAFLAEIAAALSQVGAADRERYGTDLFGTKYEDISTPILDMANGLALTADTAGELTKQFETFRSANPMTPMNDTLSGMKSLIEGIGKSALVGLAPAFEAFNAWAASDEGQVAIANFTQSIADLAVSLGEGLVNGIQWVIENWDTLEPILEGVLLALVSIGGITKGVKIGQAFAKAWPWVVKLGKGIGSIAGRIPVLAAVVFAFFDSLAQMEWLYSNIDKIKLVIGALLTAWGNWWSEWWTDVKNRWNSNMDWLENTWNDSINWIKAKWNAFADALQSTIEKPLNWVEDKFASITSWLDNIGTKFSDFMGSLGSVGDITMPSFITGLIPHANGISDVPFDNYPAALHKGETVLPAEEAELIRSMAGHRYPSRGGGRRDIVVQFNGDNHYSNDMDAQRVAYIAVRAVKDKMTEELFTGPEGVYEV